MLKFHLKTQSNFFISIMFLFFIFNLYSMCSPENSKAQERYVNEFIYDDTTGLIIADYKKWFLKYAAPHVALSQDHCAEVGCFFPDGVSLLDSLKREYVSVSFGEVDWNDYICDTSLLKKKYNLRGKEKIKSERIIYFSHQMILGKTIYPEKQVDTIAILFLSVTDPPIIQHAGNHVTMGTVKKLSLL